MPNGKPGDHWYTDVVVHKLGTFTPEIDALIRDLDAVLDDPRHVADPPTEAWAHPIRLRTQDIVNRYVMRAPNEWNLKAEDLASLERELRTFRASIS